MEDEPMESTEEPSEDVEMQEDEHESVSSGRELTIYQRVNESRSNDSMVFRPERERIRRIPTMKTVMRSPVSSLMWSVDAPPRLGRKSVFTVTPPEFEVTNRCVSSTAVENTTISLTVSPSVTSLHFP
ncbi:hypothetical protein PsorP6_015306 [Peronosclerospora sorghi]|uniref:Uncharacterized protein n=1 Tax=Peronosclerospora sorghi TaxID=230839 RepID=A0ACC0VT59_9STRA|nr:hypothetical protein PsorP6_015306 [Peronosclerospora sorghi]